MMHHLQEPPRTQFGKQEGMDKQRFPKLNLRWGGGVSVAEAKNVYK